VPVTCFFYTKKQKLGLAGQGAATAAAHQHSAVHGGLHHEALLQRRRAQAVGASACTDRMHPNRSPWRCRPSASHPHRSQLKNLVVNVILLAPSPHPCLNSLRGDFGDNSILNHFRVIHALRRYKHVYEMHSFIQLHSAFLELLEFQFDAV
jgi:hypothetical protein